MSKSNEGANIAFRGMSRPYSLYPRRESNIIGRLRVTDRGEVNNYLHIKRGIVVGGVVEKDMDSENYTSEFDPHNLQEVLFPGMADFIEGNIEPGGDKNEGNVFVASYWNDLGNDVFDDWGYFFLYDVVRGKYYFPILNPINQADGVITTQNFSCFDKTFTINHGWVEKGIFMMNISCSDSAFAFRFGAYGNFGSDEDEDDYDMTTTYGETNKTLYYHHHGEQDDDDEILYSYFVPYNDANNATKPYESLYNPENTDDNSLITKSITQGIRIFFAKQNDVKDWVIKYLLEEDISLLNGDLKVDGNVTVDGSVFVEREITCNGYILGKRNIVYMVSNNNNNENNGDEDYYASSNIVEGYFISNGLTDNRTFYIPSADVMAGSIQNYREGTTFRVTINNTANVESGYSWNLNFGNNVSPEALKSSSVGPGVIATYIVSLYDGEGVAAKFYQEGETAQIIIA